MQTFVSLPEHISSTIASLLAQYPIKELVSHAQKIHERYTVRDKEGSHFLHDREDVMAYLGMRAPATYAQIYGALLQIQSVLPSFQPKSLLDIGSGPGTALWAAKTLWPTLTKATCIDQEKHFIAVGKEIAEKSHLSMEVSWTQKDIMLTTVTNHDLIIVANVLNELSSSERKQLLEELTAHCTGILVIIESGTPLGFEIVQKAAKAVSPRKTLLAPYVHGAFVESHDYWIHFPQRFIRPEFQRRIRQHMRDDSLTASDWEEAKYSYVAASNNLPSLPIWARSVGPLDKQKGLLKIPVLTESSIETVTVLKRHKKEYNFVKELKWGDVIEKKEDLIYT